MGGETLQELKTTKTWLRQKVVGPGYASCEQWFFLGQIFITWQQKEWSATHTKYLYESIFVPPKMPQSCQNLRNILAQCTLKLIYYIMVCVTISLPYLHLEIDYDC
jgi:hypothetical protein